jgi:phage-related holin
MNKPAMLHNYCRKHLRDASNKEIENSIVWYERQIKEWVGKYGCPVPASFHDNLAILKAERTNRVGK